ncbi:hypothetical protein Cgig2_002395 [Carnegiea gigantea]|uniref:Uncharacterized protein n=1 Tax=Carnegiea gigantea TaxID=171969 RepID=A0A9Q1QNH4_9CARY|nr:hypothetical protein Cgig2_002395 [Carnegiea gigantea]
MANYLGYRKGGWGDVGGWERRMLSSKEDSNVKTQTERTGSAVRMDGDGAGEGNGGVGKELVVYVLWVGKLEEDGDGKLTYVGGSTKCILLKEGMAMEEVLRQVTGIRGSDLRDGKLWYSLKYDRQMLMAIEGDVDVRMILKENDEHGHLYVGGKEGPKRPT